LLTYCRGPSATTGGIRKIFPITRLPDYPKNRKAVIPFVL
jgi:hypothetical protein